VGRFRDEDWAAAKRQCRLSAEEVRMARELGLNPRKLSRHIPSPAQRWKLRVGAWVRELYGKRHGTSASEPRRAPRRRPERAQEPGLSFDDGFETFQEDTSWLDPDPTQIEDEDRLRLRHREAFRRAADYVAAAFTRLTFVQRVVLFGSVAQPPRTTHESKDVDLAVWVSEVSDLKGLQRARGGALNDLLADFDMGVAHHQVDVFLFESRTDRYLGRLCHFGVCPKDKPECRVTGCGATLFLRQHDGFVFDPRSLEHGSVVLFDRAKGLLPPDQDDIPL
jgi:predicted nucleotidyltransferase